MNPLVGLYRFPRGEDLSYYKDNYEIYDPERKLGIQNWHTLQKILSRILIGYRTVYKVRRHVCVASSLSQRI